MSKSLIPIYNSAIYFSVIYFQSFNSSIYFSVIYIPTILFSATLNPNPGFAQLEHSSN